MNKILIIAPNWLGDAVMSLPLIQYLSEKEKSIRIDVLANPLTADLYRLSPIVNQVIIGKFSHKKLEIKKRYDFAKKKIAPNKYHQAFILPNSLKSAIIPFLAKIPERFGYLGEFRYYFLTKITKLTKSTSQHQAIQYLALANQNAKQELINYPPILQYKQELQNSQLSIDSLNLKQEYAIICPGAQYGLAKMWPPSYFSQVVDYLVAKKLKVVILGSASDIDISSEIINNLKKNHKSKVNNLSGKTTIKEVSKIISQAKIIISNDSGLMHLSAAIINHHQKLLAIFGSTSRAKTQPISKNQSNIKYFEVAHLDCKPCFKPTCRYIHYRCLYDIKPHFVIAEIDKIINQTPNPQSEKKNKKKSTLRKQLRLKREEIMNSKARPITAKFTKRIINYFRKNQENFKNKTIGIYSPIGSEINLLKLYLFLCQNNYQLALPSFSFKSNIMDYRLFNNRHINWQSQSPLEHLPSIQFNNQKIYMGDGKICNPEVLIIPCLGFSKKGFRIGYGGGYFDEYLKTHQNILSMGISHDKLEIFDNKIFNDQDQLLSIIFTEERIIKCQ